MAHDYTGTFVCSLLGSSLGWTCMLWLVRGWVPYLLLPRPVLLYCSKDGRLTASERYWGPEKRIPNVHRYVTRLLLHYNVG